MPDARVQDAIGHWAPRFTAQGIDPNDFQHVAASIASWEEWLDAWVVMGEEHEGLAAEAHRAGRTLTAGEAYVRAALCYHFAKFVWLVDLVKHQAATGRAMRALYAAHRLLDPTAERVEFTSEGVALVGNLRRPMGVTRPPLVLLVPGLDSAKEEFFHWEQVFLARGMATFSLDGPGQGESGERSWIRPDYEVAVSAALDTLAGRPDLDLRRVGAAGVSLGGYYVSRAAAYEPRLRAAAAIGGPYNFGDCWSQLPSLTRQTFTHHSGAQDDREGRTRALALSLEAVARRITQPLLVVSGKLDRLIPWEQAERLAREAPGGELVIYPDGNHVCNNIPYKSRPLVADWLAERLRDVA